MTKAILDLFGLMKSAAEHHFEQNLHVRHRLNRYGAGRCLEYQEAVDPDGLTDAIRKEVEHEVAYPTGRDRRRCRRRTDAGWAPLRPLDGD